MRLSVSLAINILLHVLIARVAAQDNTTSLPQCALNCADTIPNARNQALVCTDSTLRMQVGACIQNTCTVKESLTAQNVTANSCGGSHQDRSALIRYGTLSLFILTTAAVAARIVTRLPPYSPPLGPDDFVIIAVWMLLIAFTTLVWVVSHTGLGRDIWTIPFDGITTTLMYFSILTYIYILLAWSTKISILLLYLRLFPDHTFRRVVKVTVVLCCITGISFCVTCIFRCHPIDFAWTFWDNEHKGRCSDILISAQGWPHVSVNIFADLVVLVLPLPTLLKLNLATEKKLSVIAMFSVGIFVTAVSVYRATTFPRLVASTNFTWEWTQSGLWSAIEIYVGVACACMPGMRAFYTQVCPGKRRKEMRHKKIRAYSSSTDPSSLGTSGSTGRMGSNAKRDDEFELIANELMQTFSRDGPMDGEEAESLRSSRRNLF